MSKEYQIEALIVSIERAIDHATKAHMDVYFVSELKHLLATTMHNREEIKRENSRQSS